MGDFNKLFKYVSANDNPDTEPYGWIQHKGTDICIDLHCVCGYHGHYDGDFFYFYECPECHRKYAVGQNVKLIELPKELHAEVDSHVGFKSDEPTDDYGVPLSALDNKKEG